MNKLDRLYKKALQGAKDKRSRELLAQGVEYMGVWSDAMTYCYANGIEVPEDHEEAMDVLRRACVACGHSDQADGFLEWYFDADNDSLFITIDYGEEGLVYGYQAENADADRDQANSGQSGEHGIKQRDRHKDGQHDHFGL